MNRNIHAEIFDPAFTDAPYPTYAAWREEGPVHRTELPNGFPLWLITRYEDARRILKDHQRFVKNPVSLMTEEEIEKMPQASEGMRPFMHHLLAVDVPDHTRLRKLVQKAFTPRFVEERRGRVQRIADELLDQVEERARQTGQREMNLIDDYAFPLPITVISEILGIPYEDREDFRRWSNAAIETDASPDYNESIASEMGEFADYLRALFDKKRRKPEDDLVTGLLRAEEEGETLSENELLSMVFILIVAGHETTVNLIGNGTLSLLTYPEELKKLQADPSLIVPTVEELLRYDGPVERTTMRFTTEDAKVGDTTIPKGAAVMVALASADRDQQQFESPDEVNIERRPAEHLAFGKGIHVCLGAPLARMEGQISIGTLVKRMPNLQMATSPEKLIWRKSLLIRGMVDLPLTF